MHVPLMREQTIARSFARLTAPRGIARKAVFAAILTTHMPLLAMLAWIVLTPGHQFTGTIAAVLVTFVVTLISTLVLLALLMPVLRAAATLETYMTERDAGRPTGEADTADGLADRLAATLHELDEQLRRLERASSTDPLTDIYNRRAGELRLAESLARLRRDGSGFMLVLLDVDGLKAINDTHGHAVGDLCLTHMVDTLRQRLRGADWLARWGGDEFIIGLHAPPAQAEALANRILESLATAPLSLSHDTELRLTASLGVAPALETDNIGSLFARADKALYAAKRGGRSRHAIEPPA